MLDELFSNMSGWCGRSERPAATNSDEPAQSANTSVLLGFLAQLRADCLEREYDPAYGAIRSVAFVGVTHVFHLEGHNRYDASEATWAALSVSHSAALCTS